MTRRPYIEPQGRVPLGIGRGPNPRSSNPPFLAYQVTRRTCYTLHVSGPVVVYTFHVYRTIVTHIPKFLVYFIIKVKGGGSKPQSRVAWASFETPRCIGRLRWFLPPSGGVYTPPSALREAVKGSVEGLWITATHHGGFRGVIYIGPLGRNCKRACDRPLAIAPLELLGERARGTFNKDRLWA